ncbi:uncharacterized protein [Miscanthus floridulus]|uniref:uncharacterized protein n=1 Tax=Miscanthus floridulus TaxID=154761 RepID=UPI0034589AB6
MTIEAAAAGTGALTTTEATMAEAGAPVTTEATMVEAGAPGTTEADVIVARLSAQEVEMKAAEASVAPLVQGPPLLRESTQEVEVLPISSDDTSRAQEMAGAEELETRSLGKSVFLRWERDVWDLLQWLKGLLAGANELLLARSVEVEDLRLRCADTKVEAATAQEQLAPLVAWVKELEEELTRMAKLGSEASKAAKASRVEAQRLKEKAKASRVEVRRWELKAKESEVEVTQVAEASVVVQAVLEIEIGEHEALKSATRTTCEAFEVEGVQSGSSLESRLIALSMQVRERLRGALHTGVKGALAIIASHYIGVDLQAISDGYVLPDDDEEADEAVAKLMEAAEGLGTALAKLFKEEVVAPLPSADAGGPEP